MREEPDRGCLLALALSCLFWGGVLLLWLAYEWGWLASLWGWL